MPLSSLIKAAGVAVIGVVVATGCDLFTSPEPELINTRIQVVAGEGQMAPAGSPLPQPVILRVVQGSGTFVPVRGAKIRWEVAGGGSVEPSEGLTDDEGRASLVWTLGADPVQKLRAVVDAAAVETTISASHGSELLSVGFTFSTNGDWCGFNAWINNTYALASATASVQGLEAPLKHSSGALYNASLDCRELPYGPVVAQIRATDVRGNHADKALEAFVDHPPRIEITWPPEGFLARPNVPVDAACVDDGPAPCRLVVSLNGSVIAEGDSRVQLPALSLAPHEGQEVVISFAAGPTQVHRNGYVDTSPKLRMVAAAPSAQLIDASEDRILYLEPTTTPASLAVHHLASAQSTRVFSPTVQPDVANARLSVSGVVFQNSGIVRTWSPSAGIEELGAGSFELDESGRYLAYSGSGFAFRRDLTLETSEGLPSTGTIAAVAPNGDVILFLGDGVYCYRNGATTLLDPYPAERVGQAARTDGTTVAYTFKHTYYNVIANLRVVPASGEVVEVAAGNTNHPLGFVADGRLTYSLPPSWQIWQWNGSTSSQETLFAKPLRLEASFDDGSFLFVHAQTRSTPSRYLQYPGQPEQRIGLGSGRAIVRSGRVYVLMGRQVLEVMR